MIGKTFYDFDGKKCTVANIFTDGKNEVVTYKYWSKRWRSWKYVSEKKNLFLIVFEQCKSIKHNGKSQNRN